MVGVRERVRHRELRPVRDAVERDLVDAERLADGLEVFRVLRGAVEVRRRTEAGAARGRSCTVRGFGERGLERRAVEEAGLARAAVVVCDEVVTREEVAEERVGGGVAEREDVGGALPGPAGDQEDRAARDAVAGSSSTWREIVPGTTPVRSSGTTTWVQMSPAAWPHRSAAFVLFAAKPVPGEASTASGTLGAAGLGAAEPAAVANASPRSAAPTAATTPRFDP